MKKFAAKIKFAWRRVSCLLAIEGLLPFAGLLVARPALRPIPVRAERVVRYSK